MPVAGVLHTQLPRSNDVTSKEYCDHSHIIFSSYIATNQKLPGNDGSISKWIWILDEVTIVELRQTPDRLLNSLD